MHKQIREDINDIKRMLDAYTEPYYIDSKKAILSLKLCMELIDCLQQKIDMLEGQGREH